MLCLVILCRLTLSSFEAGSRPGLGEPKKMGGRETLVAERTGVIKVVDDHRLHERGPLRTRKGGQAILLLLSLAGKVEQAKIESDG
jgi:hypothetical protein